VARFARELDHRLERLDQAILRADWALQTGRSRRGAESWQVRRAKFLSDERLLGWVRSALERNRPFLLRRRLELLERVMLDAQVEQTPEVVRIRSELQRKIAAFRPRWKGRRVHRAVQYRVLHQSPREPERRQAFYMLEPLHHSLEGSLQQLVELRNERARSLGYRSMAAMRHSFDGLTPGRVQELAESAALLARGRLRALRESHEDGAARPGWHPWDFLYARFRRAPLPDRWFPREEMLSRILRAVGQWGFRTERMRFRVAFHDTFAGGLTLAPDPPRDVRIVVHPLDGWNAYNIMFHEVGHAVHSSLVRAPRHLLRWQENVPGFGAFAEGVGGLFEEIPSSAEWITTQPGVDRERAQDFARVARDGNLLWAAWHACWNRAEELLYEHPGRNPMPEAQRFERQVFGFDDYRPLSFADPFFVESPLYGSSYLLAILFGSQITQTLRELFGEPLWPNRKVGPWLSRNWFAPGSLYDWAPRLKEVTGKPFGLSAFRERFAAT
jgi:hypothetical protein